MRIRSLAFALVAFFVSSPQARGEDVSVPIGLQAELLAKLASYDRNLAARAGDRVRIAIIARSSDASSARAAAQMQKALSTIADVGGLAHDETIVTYSDSRSIAELCKQRRITIAYVTPGLAEEAGPMAKAFAGLDLLSVAGSAADVSSGIVVGFDLVSGKPKLVVHLTRAKSQNVSFRAEVLKLMRVVE